ncbi:MAG TPA: winged helix-turn-helix domain-containing protein [Bryobacteraceae bacterium]|nr:winged helix-turn-helix domain-containing protein [Bryobacteraceae bacterium]
MQQPRSPGVVRFGPYQFNKQTGELRKQGLKIRLSGKPVEFLRAVLESPGEVVTREELQKRLWPGDTVVDFESGLNTAANRLRLALSDTAEHSHYLETLARVGYRFIAPVSDDFEVPANAIEETPAPVTLETPPPAVLETVKPTRTRWILLTIAAVSIGAGAIGFSLKKPAALPVFHQVSFRRMTILAARFGPDGQTVIYQGLERRGKGEIYITHPSSPESRRLEFHRCDLGSVSRSGELALITSERGNLNELLEVPMNGGSPRRIDQGISSVDWTPDGRTMAVARGQFNPMAIEYPRGKVLYRSAGWVADLRISPDSRQLAFLEHPVRGDDSGSVALLDEHGKVRTLCGPWSSVDGLAWAPSGREIWFTAAASGLNRTLYAVGLSGNLRVVMRLPGVLMLNDISSSGQVLLSQDEVRIGMNGQLNGDSTESDLSWFDGSRAVGLSDDGKVLLFDESGEGGGPRYSVYIRRAGETAAVRVSEGSAMALSSDGSFAITSGCRDRSQLNLVSLSSGETRSLSGNGLTYDWVRVFPDGKRLLVGGALPAGKPSIFIQDLNGAKPRSVRTDTYLSNAEISPDECWIAGRDMNGKISIVPVAGGNASSVYLGFSAIPLRWSDDGKSLLVERLNNIPRELFMVNIKTGRYAPWKNLAPTDLSGVLGITPPCISKDQQSYAYSFNRTISVLFTVNGLR